MNSEQQLIARTAVEDQIVAFLKAPPTYPARRHFIANELASRYIELIRGINANSE